MIECQIIFSTLQYLLLFSVASIIALHLVALPRRKLLIAIVGTTLLSATCYISVIYPYATSLSRYSVYNTISFPINKASVVNGVPDLSNISDLSLHNTSNNPSDVNLDLKYLKSILVDNNDFINSFSRISGCCLSKGYFDNVVVTLEPTGNNKLVGYLLYKPIDYFYKPMVSISKDTKAIKLSGVVKKAEGSDVAYQVGNVTLVGNPINSSTLLSKGVLLDTVVYTSSVSSNNNNILVNNYIIPSLEEYSCHKPVNLDE
jgi:hypothetical protein